MFKILILQRLYELSDRQVEFQIADRMSLTRFLGLRIEEAIADYSTMWRFREVLVRAGAVKPPFARFGERLAAKGLLPQEGIIVDASFVEVPRQRNGREENVPIEQGQRPAGWERHPRKCAQKDVDAHRTKKNGKNFYGYKDHVRTDADTGPITDHVVTDAAVRDSQSFDKRVGSGDAGRTLWADSAYASAETDNKLRRWKVGNRVHEKGTSVRVLDRTRRRHNREKSGIRCPIEHVFGFMENTTNGPERKYVGIERIEAGIGLGNLTYNLCRFVQLLRLGRVPKEA